MSKFISILISLICLISFSVSAQIIKDSQVEHCTSIKSNMNRLSCFDKLFNTPIQEQLIDNRVVNNIIPKLVGDIFILSKIPKDEFPIDTNLEIALPSVDEDAAIYIACKDNITRFQIVIDKPIKYNPINIHIINDDTKQTLSKINWQNTERGYMVDSGRGLYAIQQLKSILYIDKFTVSIPQEKRSYSFKNNGLASQIASIRKECGW
ncbi:type VI secretion system-associated protein TagO [Rodentibacter caecimuris]|uniref:Type VI secretion protein n=1 Tax=Rodentibacter caecimuris TaxID=1796644 RepID=A0ABX3KYW8_9PAST|nr:type VI secretion protein [Rodentibacter heylii]